MKLGVFVLLFYAGICLAVIPLPGSPSWTSSDTDYSTGGAFYDITTDGWIDLAAGGWWEPVVVFENINGTINTTPVWSWNGGSGLVCETVMWGDVRNHALTAVNEQKSGDGTRKLFYLDHHPIIWSY
ncbi:MAG: hypothetical protein WBB67_14060 [bacterium]